MIKLYEKMKVFSAFLNLLVGKIVLALLLCMIGVINIQIVSREFFTAFSWTEELSRYLLIWSSFLAATIPYRKGEHIAITFVINAVKKKRLKKLIAVSVYLISIMFFFTVLYFGFKMIFIQVYQRSPAMQIPMQIVYLCIPLSMAIMLYYAIIDLFELCIKGEIKR